MGIFDKLFGKKGSSSMSSGTPRATEKCPQCFESDFTFKEKIDADQAVFVCNGCARKRGEKVALILRKSQGDWV